jgi:hypothetical protein
MRDLSLVDNGPLTSVASATGITGRIDRPSGIPASQFPLEIRIKASAPRGRHARSATEYR